MFIQYDIEKMREDLKKYLKANSMTARKFSVKSGVHESMISKIMNGVTRNPNTKTVLFIINAMDKRVDEYTYNIGNVFRVEGRDFEYLSIDDLTDLIGRLTVIRNEKIQAAISEIESQRETLNEQINIYKNYLKEGS